ncbi:MAG: NB-ARC domain-containing protein [Cyanobium sp.]
MERSLAELKQRERARQAELMQRQRPAAPQARTRVPFMAPDLPIGFVQREKEFDQLRSFLLDPERSDPVAITTALTGAGGFGKTTLAAALCHDDAILQTFDDGILWVTLGETPNLADALAKLYAGLTGERPFFKDAEDAATTLAEKLERKTCLIVIDDVWDPAHLRPFLPGGEGCARLITSRLVQVVATDVQAKRLLVNEMSGTEALAQAQADLIERWGDPQRLPQAADPAYAWRWIGYHLKEAGHQEQLDGLLQDLPWLQRKLKETGIAALAFLSGASILVAGDASGRLHWLRLPGP